MLITKRKLSQKEYDEWAKKFQDASMTMDNREEAKGHLMDAIERNLEIIGSTAIEDCLQEGVQDTLQKMREAGIKTWMITGDKVETAVNIGRSCGLIKEGALEILFDCNTLMSIKKKLNDAFSLLKDQEESQS